MIQGQGIICITQDWQGDPTSKKHIMRVLSRQNKILWVNSIGVRRPMAGPGWCLVGDAGYHMDPVTGQGTRSALIAARILRDRIAELGYIDANIDGHAMAGLTALRDSELEEDWTETEQIVSPRTD